ncbi:hypothetical protein LPJ78_003893 [Coemansia sp. RSA 989]|nr:rab-GTPase-TBC domain-containing protein [Coemansia mojavensis]KAJ1863687.1 hypothetical protein LPJ78_003893 [Coemansia sp. RSA 989]KAJ1871481.1 hypothetical protein LPJ55_003840 [Coemansia sp. RSA 990]KAJ2670497.1 hypothetical protein IWW42_003930 [Coemansia sp. RSA 1085]
MAKADLGQTLPSSPSLAPVFGRNIRKQALAPSSGTLRRRRLRTRSTRKDVAFKQNCSAPPSLSSAQFPQLGDRPKSLVLPVVDVWTSGENDERLGRSASCCEAQEHRRSAKRISEARRHQPEELAGSRPASAPLVCHKMARISCAATSHYSDQLQPSMALERMVGAADNSINKHDETDIRASMATPQFLRQLNVLKQLCHPPLATSHKSDDEVASENEALTRDTNDKAAVEGRKRSASLPWTPAVDLPAHTVSMQRRRISGKLAQFTRRLIGGLAADSKRELGSEQPSGMNSPMHALPAMDSSALATFSSKPSGTAQQQQQQHSATVTRRLHRRPAPSMIATRRNVTLTIPTTTVTTRAQVPPGMFAIPALSPACTSLHSEAVTASATACGSVTASPVLSAVESRAHAVFDDAAPATAHGMLCRLAGGSRSSSEVEGGTGEKADCSQSLPQLHTNVHEEWGLFITSCIKNSSPFMESLATLDGVDEPFDAASFPASALTAVVPVGESELPQRWFSGLGSSGDAQFYSLVAKGVPADFRRQVWMESAGALDVTERRVDMDMRREEIELDLARTSSESTAEMAALRHVLYGYAGANPDVGYCQGMDKIAQGLLDAGLGAADALRMLQAVLDGGVLPADMFRPPMMGVQADQLVLERLVAQRLPQLAEHLHQQGAPLAPVTVTWFLTLFCDCLPRPHRLRVWDVLFVRGYSVMFQASLGLLELCQPSLLQCTAPSAVYSLLQNVAALVAQVPPDEFAQHVFAPWSQVEPNQLDALRQHVWSL